VAWAVYGLVATGLLTAGAGGADAGSDANSAVASSDVASDAGTSSPVADGSALGETRDDDCCAPGSAGACGDPDVLACVCEGDPFCCSDAFDALCVTQAITRCQQACALEPPVNDCCSASNLPGCVLPEIAACVCSIDPFCCAFRFDQNCVNLAQAACELSCHQEQGSP
jgi:hypothetical protein